jgi:nickel transport protein
MTVKFKIHILISLYLGALAIIPDSAHAHRVNVFAWVDGDTIQVESKFSGGKRVKSGKVVVMDPQGVELLSGLTNDQGEFSFKVPKQSDLRIIIMAGQGHQGEWTVREAELQGLTLETATKPAGSKSLSSDQEDAAGSTYSNSDDAASNQNINVEELESIIETALDRKLQPVTRMLADMQQEGPGVSDIFAGIGYILGLVGIAAYIQNRKKKA